MLADHSMTQAEALITLFSNRELDALVLGKTDPRHLTLTNDKDVRKTGGKSVIARVLQMNNVESTKMALPVSDNTNSSHIVTTCDNGNISGFKFGDPVNLSGLQVEANSVIDL